MQKIMFWIFDWMFGEALNRGLDAIEQQQQQFYKDLEIVIREEFRLRQ